MAKSALIDDLEKQFAENPRRVFARLANEYRKAGELETAIEICHAHVPLQPTYISGYIVLGQALFESGQLDEARSTFETALGLDPENLIALRQLGDIARAGGDATGARGWYRRLLEVDPQNEEIVALVDELAAEPEGHAAPPAAAAPVSWGDINPEQPPAEAPPQPPAVQAVAEPPAPPPAATTPQGATPPEAVFEPLDLSDLQLGGAEPPAPPAQGEATGDAPPADMRGFDFESLSSFGMESSDAGHVDVEGIERADELFSPDAANAGRPIPGLEIEGLERGGYLQGAQPPEVAPEPGVLGQAAPTSPFGDLEDRLPSGPAEEIPSSAETEQPAPEAAAEPGVPQAAPEGVAAAEGDAEAAAPAFVTETMAELYLRQGHREAALDIYRQLAAQRPEDAALLDRIAELEQPERQGAPEHTVRAFFARLALKHPPYAAAVSPTPPAGVEPPPPPGAPEPSAAQQEPATSEGAAPVTEREAAEARAEAVDLETELGFAEAFLPPAGGPGTEPAASSPPPAIPQPAAAVPEPTAFEPAAPEPTALEPTALEPAEPEPPPSEPPSSEPAEPEPPPLEPTEPEPRAAEAQPVAELLFGPGDQPPLPAAPLAAEPVSAEPEPAEPVPLVQAAIEPDLPPAPPSVAAQPADSPPLANELIPSAEAAPIPEPELGVDELLAAEAASPEDEIAAASLAAAFAPEMAPLAQPGQVGGQPARAAADPLSLDTVFREGRGGAEGQPQSNVSFDQFFAGEEDATPASDAGGEGQPGAGASPDRDLELFQAWLEGLKK